MGYTRDENSLFLCGRLAEGLVAEHEAYGETLYVGAMDVMRLSGTVDTLPITVPGRIMQDVSPGDYIELRGQLRSYNRHYENGSRLLIRAFARDIAIKTEPVCCANSVLLTGSICRPTVFRVTPFCREITDILLAVNRDYKKADYIPCIAWGSAAHIAAGLSVGARIRIEGRLQSRSYTKTENGVSEVRTAYELSCTHLVQL